MKKILVITAEFFPHPSSNTLCISPFLDEFRKNKWSIDIITAKQWIDLPTYEIDSNGNKIYRINDPRSQNTILYNKMNQINSPKFLKFINRSMGILSKSLFYIYYCSHSPDKRFAGWNISDAVTLGKNLINENHYDYILSLAHPALCHEIVYKILNNISIKPKWILVDFDLFCYNTKIYSKKYFKKNYSYQHLYYKQADYITLTPELYSFYQVSPFKLYSSKMIVTELPNFISPAPFLNQKHLSLNTDSINCTFAGSLSKNVRNPLYCMKAFSKCLSSINFNIITSTSMKYYLNNISSNNNNICVFPQQPHEIAFSTLLHSNILVNIGNKDTIQSPGKIFEYMSTGKPIIHFQKTEEDPCIRYLENYPYKLIIKEYSTDLNQASKLIERFCNDFKNVSLTFKEISSKLPQFKQENVVQKFYRNFEEI